MNRSAWKARNATFSGLADSKPISGKCFLLGRKREEGKI
jgi:hypothetical protein